MTKTLRRPISLQSVIRILTLKDAIAVHRITGVDLAAEEDRTLRVVLSCGRLMRQRINTQGSGQIALIVIALRFEPC